MAKKKSSKKEPGEGKPSSNTSKYPRHTLEKCLRIPKAIIEQNAGKECSEEDSAKYVGIKYSVGPYTSEISSALKYGLLERPSAKRLMVTDLAKMIIKPKTTSDTINGLRQAVLKAPVIADVYQHYRNENLPDSQFFNNALVDNFKIPANKLSEFRDIFLLTLKHAELSEEVSGKIRLIDISGETSPQPDNAKTGALVKLEKAAKVVAGDSCFVMMPYAKPIGDYYEKIYERAITKAGLKAVRADADIFGTGKIIDQIWTGINNARVLVAELTGRNPNVFYELGLAHALGKPVVLVCSNETDVPFDLKHIRVIYYDCTDPFWGNKLIDKVAENILSALKTPEEAVFKRALSSAET